MYMEHISYITETSWNTSRRTYNIQRSSPKVTMVIVTFMFTSLTSGQYDYPVPVNWNWIMWINDDVIKWKHFPRYWPFVRGIHRSPVNSAHKGQWRGALMFSLICARINGWVNNGEAGDLIRHWAHYGVIVMISIAWNQQKPGYSHKQSYIFHNVIHLLYAIWLRMLLHIHIWPSYNTYMAQWYIGSQSVFMFAHTLVGSMGLEPKVNVLNTWTCAWPCCEYQAFGI